MAEDTEMGDSEECSLIVEAAMETASERCGSRGAVFEQVTKFFGDPVEAPDGVDRTRPQPEDCEEILEDGIGRDDLQTSRTQRRYAMCRAWELIDDDENDVTFQQAISTAWEEVNEAEEREIARGEASHV